MNRNPVGAKRVLDCYPQLDRVVGRVNQILLRAEVSLGGLDRSMTQQQLDLLQFAATGGGRETS